MQWTSEYESPVGKLLLASDVEGLTGLWIEGQKHFALYLDESHEPRETKPIELAKEWLDSYFAGVVPQIAVPLHFTGTPFQNEVWEILAAIPYGQTTTYGDIANEMAARRGMEHMSARAVGGAVGHNQISIIVPCHRVIGSNGKLTGYAGGLEKKAALLNLEGSAQRKAGQTT